MGQEEEEWEKKREEKGVEVSHDALAQRCRKPQPADPSALAGINGAHSGEV